MARPVQMGPPADKRWPPVLWIPLLVAGVTVILWFASRS
jgi:hypothetical protein